MYNSLYKDFGDTLQRIHECEMIAMHNCVAHLQNKPYILPEVRQTSLLEGDIQKLNDITSVLNSGDFSQLLGNVEGISSLGLVYNNYLECTTNVSEKFDALRVSLKEKMTSVVEGKDETACGSFVKTVKDPSFAATLCCGKKEMDEACFTTTGFRQISADDVEKAKATLEGAKDKIKAHQDRMKANLDKKKQVLQNMDKKMEDSAKKINSAKKEDCDKICDEAVVVACYLEMSDMIDHAECVALTNQILEEAKQAYTMLRMLQEHNARNIKESKVITGFIQESAMNSFEDFIQNPTLSKCMGGGQPLIVNEAAFTGNPNADMMYYAAAAKRQQELDNKFKYTTKIKKDSIKDAEKELGVIPLSLKMIILKYNGGQSKCHIKIKNKDVVFGGLLSFNKNDSESVYSLNLDDFKSKKLIPFGTTPFGDIWCYNRNTHTVVLYNHESDKFIDSEKSISKFFSELT